MDRTVHNVKFTLFFGNWLRDFTLYLTSYSVPPICLETTRTVAPHASRLVRASRSVSSDSSRPCILYLLSLPVNHSLILLTQLALVDQSSCSMADRGEASLPISSPGLNLKETSHIMTAQSNLFEASRGHETDEAGVTLSVILFRDTALKWWTSYLAINRPSGNLDEFKPR